MISTESIHSYVRLKPEQGQPILHIENDNKTVSLTNYPDRFQFERAFDVTSTNAEVYKQVGAGLIRNAMDGFNCCIFAYGQTSSGKTHTIRGSEVDQGLIKLALTDIYNYDRSRVQIEAIINYMEIYNQTINDLLNTQNTNLTIRDDGNKNIIIDRLSDWKCQSLQEALKCIEKGEINRKYGSTEMNGLSSRSHCIFRIKLKVKERNQGLKSSIINIIDLAGSQCISKTKAEGLARKEGQNINKSLLFLSNIIRGLSQKENVVNYRDSKLTRILQSSISGNSKTSVICTVNILSYNSAETINTLKFGVSAGQVKVKPKLNIEKQKQRDKRSLSLSPLGPKTIIEENTQQRDKQNQKLIKNGLLLDEYKSKCNELEDQNQQLQNIIQRQHKDIDLLNMSLNNAKNQKSNREETINRLNNTIKKLQDETQKLNSRTDRMEEQRQATLVEIKQLKQINRKLQNENEIHIRNKEEYEKNITKMNKEKNEIQRNIKAEKRKIVEFKDKINLENTPFELETLMKHSIEILEKNKQINYLKERLIYLQKQVQLEESEDVELDEEEKVEKMSRRKIKKMRTHIERARKQDQKNSRILMHCNSRIMSLEKQLLECKLTKSLDNEAGIKVLAYLENSNVEKESLLKVNDQ